MPSQPEAQGDILKEFREGTFLSSLDTPIWNWYRLPLYGQDYRQPTIVKLKC